MLDSVRPTPEAIRSEVDSSPSPRDQGGDVLNLLEKVVDKMKFVGRVANEVDDTTEARCCSTHTHMGTPSPELTFSFLL